MSDYWEFFPCAMGESQASIFYDHGINDEINNLEYEYAFRIRAKIKRPNENGLTTNEEYDEISSMEDLLSNALEKLDCIFVGRVTVDGYRYFIFYTNTPEETLCNTLDKIADKTGYELSSIYEHDPDKSEYWDNLFPTKADWQVIQDMKVLDALTEEGDLLEKPRKIFHWAYFDNQDNLNSFSSWLIQEGFEIQNKTSPDDEIDQFGIQFQKIATPTLKEITSITINLNMKAEEMNGDYSGWETSVEK